MDINRSRFEALDGLRGTAAIAVLLFHLKPPNEFSSELSFFSHGYLAVDFFFLLSGFVITSAYEDRLRQGLKKADFFRLRLIRLYPLIVISVIFGIIGYLNIYSPIQLFILAITAFFLIPTSLGAISENQPTIAINPPSWSLLWELIANLIFATFAFRLSNKSLLLIIVLSWIAQLTSSYALDGLNNGGLWNYAWAGAPRVSFSFFLGMLLLRLFKNNNLPTILNLPFSLSAAILLFSTMMPMIYKWNWLYDISIITILFPILIVSSCLTKTSKMSNNFCIKAGLLSYPIYILQSGIIPHMRGLPAHLHLNGFPEFGLITLMVLLFSLFSWFVLKKIDEPVRAWLTEHYIVNKGITSSRLKV